MKIKCCVCGKEFYAKPFRVKRTKHELTCSKECGRKYRSQWFSGENNHQYGLKEDKNPTFKNWKRKSTWGYILVHRKDHPFHNSSGMVLEHRLIIEENADKFDDKYFVEIDGKKYLKKEYQVHHKNEIKSDNRLENLVILTKSEHQSLHNKQREVIRRRNETIYSFQKKGEPIPVKIKLFDGGKLPTRQTSGAACFDCYSNENKIIKAHSRELIKLGFGLDLPYMFEAQIRPRSGLSKKGIDIAFGTIDEDFKFEISANIINTTDTDFEVKRYDRICQIAIKQIERMTFEIVDNLGTTDRTGGFGSTGI